MQNTAFSTNKTLNINGRLIDLTTPRVMGILNITPDSFFDGGHYLNENDISKKAVKMFEEGATFIDVGGYSSRPGATHISEEEELNRVLKALRVISKEIPQAIISIDTFRSGVAKTAVNEGAHIINDISGGNLDAAMLDTVAELKVPYILMHMKGTPQNMVEQANYDNLLHEIIQYFHQKIHILHEKGVKDLIIDPGFGFAKKINHNFDLLNQLELLNILEKPILTGLSRKSMIWKTLGIQPEDALNGTTVLNTIALLKGVSILRVHDVKEAIQVIQLTNKLALNQLGNS